MTQQEIEAFLETVKQGSISAAAEKFYITQPALSRRISILEEELGYVLFHRRKGSRNVELTEEGKAFLPIARKTLQLWQGGSCCSHAHPQGIAQYFCCPQHYQLCTGRSTAPLSKREPQRKSTIDPLPHL